MDMRINPEELEVGYNIPAIVGMGRACELAAERTTKLSSDCLGLRDFLEQKN